MPVNYQNSKIYKIWSPSHPELVYYGSSTQTLSKRMVEHRGYLKDKCNITSKLITIYDDARIELVEDYPCDRKEQLHAREGHFIKENDCVNKNIPGRTDKEYYEDNREKIITRHKQYYNNNKEMLLEKHNQYVKTEHGREMDLTQCKKYRDKHKETLKKRDKESRIECECGGSYFRKTKSHHMLSNKHMNYELNNKE